MKFKKNRKLTNNITQKVCNRKIRVQLYKLTNFFLRRRITKVSVLGEDA
jgi:hypothetical protein